jgi:hypothetical protein
VPEVGAVQGDGVLGAAQRERRPCGESEVGVDEVELAAAVAAAQLARASRVAAGREGEDLDLDLVELAQGVDLVAHEAAESGLGGRRPHVRDDQDTHSRVILHSCRLSPLQRSIQTRSRSQTRA